MRGGIRSNDGPTSNAADLGRPRKAHFRLRLFCWRERTRNATRAQREPERTTDDNDHEGHGTEASHRAAANSSKAPPAPLRCSAPCRRSFPAGAFAQAAGPEVKGAKLGFIALTDAAPLFVAKEKGFFAKHGMPDIEVLKQASWGATRDNLVLGSEGNGIDGAHILTPMPYLISAGKVTQNNVPTPMYILARLNLDSQCISVAKEYADLRIGLDTKPFKEALEKKKASGKAVKAANTFPGGTHDLWIRYWLAAGGIDPDKDIETITVPPPQMVANMKVGTMDCFCVCEPWNLQLVHQNIGYTAITTGELWNKHPEKSLGMRAAWVDKNPNAVEGDADGGDGSAAVVRQAREPRRARAIMSKRQWINAPVRGHHRSHQGQVRLRHPRQGGREHRRTS